MLFAIAPRGAGKPVGARAIERGWPLADGETLVVEAEGVKGMVLAEDGKSLRPGTTQELAPKRRTAEEKLAGLGLTPAELKALLAD